MERVVGNQTVNSTHYLTLITHTRYLHEKYTSKIPLKIIIIILLTV